MKEYSRREFLRQIGAAVVLVTAGRTAFSLPRLLLPGDPEPFEMLVIGDSLIWGQGLEENDKFYTLVKTWLEESVFEGSRAVNLKVGANSGAAIYLHEFNGEALRKAGQDEVKNFHREVNVGLPTITKQVELARDEYLKEGKQPESVKLVMLTGGITDITVAEVLGSDESDEKLRADIVKYCNKAMFTMLEKAATIYPNALFAVIGYYPLISAQASTKKVLNAILELYRFPRPFKFLVNNIVGKQFFKASRDKAIRRSKIWVEGSNREMQNAVERVNARFKSTRAVFIKSPINEQMSFGTKNSVVWGMGKNGKSADPLYSARERECKPNIEELGETTGIKYPVRFCELAGIGHPNPEGAKLYAKAITTALMPLLAGEHRTGGAQGSLTAAVSLSAAKTR